MASTTIIIPISRPDYLDKVFHSLEMLKCDPAETNLLAIVDGPADLFLNVRNRVEMSRFAQRLAIQFNSKHKLRHYDLLGRRMRIADIHNEIRKHIWDCDFIFGLEDDTIIPFNALQKLMRAYGMNPYAGFIEGVEVGRWGIPYIGAWKIDDVYDTKRIESIAVQDALMKDPVQPIDAGGMYCFLTRSENYLNHEFKPFDRNALGPDVDWGIELRRQGLMNFIDWSILCTHKSKDRDYTVLNSDVKVVTFEKQETRWRQSHK